MTKPLDTPVLQARDLIAEVLGHRRNLKLTDAVIRDAANNAATALIPLLEDLQRGSVAKGEIGAMPEAVSDEPPAVRVTVVQVPVCACGAGPGPHASWCAVVSCRKTRWCIQPDNHDGECSPPF
jgi:hypothetical protein